MINLKAVKRQDVVVEMRHLVNNYLVKHGPITGLQMELNHENYMDPNYLREKIRLVKSTMDALEHDLRILENSEETP